MSHQTVQGWKFRRWVKKVTALATLWLAAAPLAVLACDTFDGSTLTIPKVVVGNTVYTNVHVRLGLPNVKSVGGAVGNAATADTYDVYDATTGLVTIPCVTVGAITYSNVVTSIIQVLNFGGSYALAATPVVIPRFPLPAAVVGTAYSQSTYTNVVPQSQYTFTIDSLANGNGVPPGMTLNLNGILSGTPFATGATDVNGHQVPHSYTFGVCATDTLSRVTSATPCPQVTVTVNPALPNLAGTWSGSWSTTGPGDGGCIYNDSGNLTLTLTQTKSQDGTTATLSGTASADGIQLQWVPDCVFAEYTSSQSSVTGTIAADGTISLQYTLPIQETGHGFAFNWSLTPSGTTSLKGSLVSSTLSGSFTLTHQ
ncbi:MAG TPA: hypothetical protein VMH83_13090 [Candidatus Acidoferrum sp.]|nr:hypothetical protein [Candidatus Acidoferrum sp.]